MNKRKIILHVGEIRRQLWKTTLTDLLPDFDIVRWDEDDYSADEIEYAIVWNPPRGGLSKLPNLKCTFCVGAGVSHLLNDPSYPTTVPLVRTTGPDLVQRMIEYVILHVLRAHRKLHLIEQNSKQGVWKQYIEPTAQSINVGVMGLGNIGLPVAMALKNLNYSVRGLKRTYEQNDEIETFSFDDVSQFASELDIVISLLPETPETKCIIDEKLIGKLRDNAWVINAGRGSHVNDRDLLMAIENSKLSGAVLDVFREEPLPADSPFWNNPNILITSHTASAIEPSIGANIIAKNLSTFDDGEVPGDIVNIDKGY